MMYKFFVHSLVESMLKRRLQEETNMQHTKMLKSSLYVVDSCVDLILTQKSESTEGGFGEPSGSFSMDKTAQK
jgi:hypothetical protein